jgi:protein O-mannosyl-transferase
MSKNKNKQTNSPTVPKTEQPISNAMENISFISKWGKYIIILFGFLLYANTLNHGYTQDDAIVIYDNMYTQKGVAGISGLLTKDTFFGFFKKEGKDKLVTGGRYRPFTPIMFALEYQIFGKSKKNASPQVGAVQRELDPFSGHLINALLYGLLGYFIFQLLSKIFNIRTDYKQHFEWVIFACVLLFMAHPIHTEAVANIKGRDEIMSMLGAIVATLFTIKYYEEKKMSSAIIAFASFFVALMSKENSITFLAIIPAIFWFFYNVNFSKSLSLLTPVIIATILFLICRTAVLGLDFGSKSMELMNNPYIKLVGNEYVPFTAGEKIGTIFYTLGYYIKLLFVPHPLTSDYYPRHIDIMSMSDPMVLLSLFTYLGLIALAFYYYKKDRVISFSILFFIATLSIVSNLFFPIGTNMSERFMFMPSLAFCLIVPHVFYKIFKNGKTTFGLIAVVVLVFSVKTFSRNMDWKDDFTLFTTDVKTSNKSAKILNAAGGALCTNAEKEKDPAKKKQMLTEGIGYLKEAIKVHPSYTNAHLLMGNSYYYLGDYTNSISSYENALKYSPDFTDAKNNLAVALRDAGRQAGEKENNLAKAEQLLVKSLQMSPRDIETLRLLGITYGMAGNHNKAIEYFKKITEVDPKNASAFLNLSNAYNYIGDQINVQKYKAIAIQLDPKVIK